jgi:hypothetical protein
LYRRNSEKDKDWVLPSSLEVRKFSKALFKRILVLSAIVGPFPFLDFLLGIGDSCEWMKREEEENGIGEWKNVSSTCRYSCCCCCCCVLFANSMCLFICHFQFHFFPNKLESVYLFYFCYF